MKKFLIVLLICINFYTLGAEDGKKKGLKRDNIDNPGAEEPSDEKSLRWGFSGSIEMGGMFIFGNSFDSVNSAGFGTIGRESIIAHLTAGINLRKPEFLDSALIISYAAGGSFLWEDIFGMPGSQFPLYGDVFALQLEVQPLFKFLNGFHPFIGGGYSFTNGLIDDFGDGFTKGLGPFAVAGINIFNSMGLERLFPFVVTPDAFFGLRISLYYRFPYEYEFKLDWNEFGANYAGASDVNSIKSFFDRTFPAESFLFSAGFSIGYTGFKFR